MAGVLEEMEVDDKITPLATSTEARSGGEAGGGGETDESRKEGTCVVIRAHVYCRILCVLLLLLYILLYISIVMIR